MKKNSNIVQFVIKLSLEQIIDHPVAGIYFAKLAFLFGSKIQNFPLCAEVTLKT